MISFKILNEDNFDFLIESLFDEKNDASYVKEYLGCIDFSDGIEYAVAASCGCVIVRMYDGGRYVFTFPEQLSSDASVSSAIEEIRKYAVKEEIPLNIAGVLPSDLPALEGFLHINLDSEDEGGLSYMAKIKNECELLSEIPKISGGRVTLNALCEDDISAYAKLCRNEELLEYWGYDYKEDYGDVSDEFFYECQARDFQLGTQLTLAIRSGGELIGALEFYAFDFRGGAEIDVRIFPYSQRRGYASEAMRLAFSLARKIGLVKLYATVMNENTPSISFFEKLARDFVKEKNITRFTLDF